MQRIRKWTACLDRRETLCISVITFSCTVVMSDKSAVHRVRVAEAVQLIGKHPGHVELGELCIGPAHDPVGPGEGKAKRLNPLSPALRQYTGPGGCQLL